jgi:hypothetical protein
MIIGIEIKSLSMLRFLAVTLSTPWVGVLVMIPETVS